jgi:hypothetical protein
VQQRLRLLQVERVEAFGEPAVDRREKIAGLVLLALIAPEPRRALSSRSTNHYASGGPQSSKVPKISPAS